MSAHARYRPSFVTLLAVLGLVGSLIFAAVRLVQADAGFRQVVDSHSNLLLITRAQTEAVLFGETLALVAAGAMPATDGNVAQRIAVLKSCVDELLEGLQRRQIAAADEIRRIAAVRETLVAAEPDIRAGLDRDATLRLQAAIGQFGRHLRELAGDPAGRDPSESFAARGLHQHFIVEAGAAVLGFLMSAAVLSFRLFDGVLTTRRATPPRQQQPAFPDLVASQSHQGVVVLDEARTCLFWNPGMQSLFGLEPKDAVGRSIEESVALFGSPELSAVLASGASDASCTIEMENTEPGSPARCLEICCRAVRMSERRFVVAYVRDVTESRRASRATERRNLDLQREIQQQSFELRRAEGRLAAVVAAAPEGFAAFCGGKLLLANDRIQNIEPVASRFRDGMSLGDFLACFAACEGAGERLRSAGHPPADVIDLELRLAPETWAHLSVTHSEKGGSFVRLSDVTSYKQASQALQSALDRERELTDAYRSFVSMVSHQFRTPLAIVDSSAQRILRRAGEATPEELAMRVKKIRDATIRLTRLVEGVLNAAKIDSGQIEIRPSLCDLVELVAEICERQRDITPAFTIRLAAPSHPVELMCDPMLIEQVLVNLLANAIKYSGTSTEIEVCLWAEGDVARCSVRDWGLGIPADELPKVFNRFYRARTAAGIAGTGIGLNVAREIIQMHGGEILVESSEALGSVFSVSIPIRGALAAPQAA